MKKETKTNYLVITAMIGSLGMEALLLTVGGAWFGGKLDQVWNTKPLWIMIGMFAGLGISFLSAVYALKRFQKKE